MNATFFNNNAVFGVNNNLDIVMSPEYLPPLLASASAAFASAEYVAPVVPVAMVSPIHETEEPAPSSAEPALDNSDGSAVRTAEVLATSSC